MGHRRYLLIATLIAAAIAITTFAAGLLPAGSARADGQVMHNPASGTLSAPCAGCHRIHTSSTEGLIRQSDPDQLCLTCHGAVGSGSDLNVDLGRRNSATSEGLRAGGFQQALIDAGDTVDSWIGVGAAEAVTSKHDVGTSGTLWGNGAAGSGAGSVLTDFRCVNCHDPHGGANGGNPTYRLLRPQPTGSGAAGSVVVTDEAAGPRHYTITNYFEPLSGLSGAGAGQGISAWCSQCHTRYLKTSSPSTPRSGDSLFKFQHRAGDSVYGGMLVCTKCHASHGTNATTADSLFAPSVTYPDGTTAAAGHASRLLKTDDRAICRKCHTDK